jgi:hypothetical protein
MHHKDPASATNDLGTSADRTTSTDEVRHGLSGRNDDDGYGSTGIGGTATTTGGHSVTDRTYDTDERGAADPSAGAHGAGLGSTNTPVISDPSTGAHPLTGRNKHETDDITTGRNKHSTDNTTTGLNKHTADDDTTSRKPTLGDKIKGTAEKLAGSVLNNDGMKQRGQERKMGETMDTNN